MKTTDMKMTDSNDQLVKPSFVYALRRAASHSVVKTGVSGLLIISVFILAERVLPL